MSTQLDVGTTTASHVRYVCEIEFEPRVAVVSVPIEPREWDVTDPAAREVAAREVLGGDYGWHCKHLSAQWYIDPDRGAAGLAVYRTPARVIR